MTSTSSTEHSFSMTEKTVPLAEKAAPSELSLVSSSQDGADRTLPNEIVEDIFTIVWLQRYMGNRWWFYRAMLGVNRQWQVIIRHLSLRFVIIEFSRDLGNYYRLLFKAKDDIPNNAELVEFFRRTHVRVDFDALVLPPMLPACRSLEITHGQVGEYHAVPDTVSRRKTLYLSSWLRIPHLKIISILQRFMKLEEVAPEIPPTITHLQGCLNPMVGSRYISKWSRVWLNQITHLRVCSLQPLPPLIEYTPNLEELTLDLRDPLDLSYTIVAALKAGILPNSKKKLILNTGPVEPLCYGSVAATCKRLDIVLERRVVYESGGPPCLAVQDGVPTFRSYPRTSGAAFWPQYVGSD